MVKCCPPTLFFFFIIIFFATARTLKSRGVIKETPSGCNLKASPKTDRGRERTSPTSVGFFFDRGAAREEAGIAGQSSLLFLPWSFIFLEFCCYVFQFWEARVGGSWGCPLQQHLLHVTHLFQDLGRAETGLKRSWVGAEALPSRTAINAQHTVVGSVPQDWSLEKKKKTLAYARFPPPSKLIIPLPLFLPLHCHSQCRDDLRQLEMPAFGPPTLLLGVAQTGLKKLNPGVTSVGSSNLKEPSESWVRSTVPRPS